MNNIITIIVKQNVDIHNEIGYVVELHPHSIIYVHVHRFNVSTYAAAIYRLVYINIASGFQ